ncbi:MAG: DUF2851 family protein, partial [Verrucomicrobiota bacterium]
MTTTSYPMEFIASHITRVLPKTEFQTLLSQTVSPPFRENQLQRLWFEGWFQNPLRTTQGDSLFIIQTGFWNHGAGPDFTHAAFRDSEGKTHFGAIELHLLASDWETHGHHKDPHYENVVLHVVWKQSSKPTLTLSGRIIPQIELSSFLSLSSEDLASIFPETSPSSLTSKPGLCHHTLMRAATENQWQIIEEAGWLRLLQKSRRLFLRQKIVGTTQALWESLAEGCGYSRNILPFRTLSHRIRPSELIGLPATTRKSILLGVSGFLPQEIHLESHQSSDLRQEAQSIWENWWRVQTQYSHSILPPRAWTLHGVRPWNRPERRIAALARLIPRLRSLKESLHKKSLRDFRRDLSNLHDPFWESHSTWNSKALNRAPLLGEERLRDLEMNLYWVWQIMEQGASLQSSLRTLRMTPNHKTSL